MGELGYPVFEKHIEERLSEMQKQQEQADESRKVYLKEKFNRVSEWSTRFAAECQDY